MVTGRDTGKLARDAYHTTRGARRTAELAEVEKLIANARYEKNAEVSEHNKERSTFRYYLVNARYKGEEETLRLNLGKNIHTGKYHFHAITHDTEK